MIEKESQKIPDKVHRKQGGAFDTLARILNGVVRVIFRNGVIMQDRPGVSSDEEVVDPAQFTVAKSVFEVYQQNESDKDGINLMYLGRRGAGDFQNTNYIEFRANKVSGYSKGGGNGQISLRMSQDEELTNGAIVLFDLEQVDSSLDGVNAAISSQGDGGSMLFYYPSSSSTSPTKYFYVGNDGILTAGIPSSDPGVAGALYTSTIITEGASYSGVLRVSSG